MEPQVQTSVKTIKCSVCGKEIPESEAVSKLRGAIKVCKDCDAKDKGTQKEGQTCEFC